MIRCIYSPFTDIYFHLAAEEYLLKQGNENIFMLWQDTPSVVIGKHQRLRSEVDKKWAEQERVHIARRFSGGGAVYHDLGNINLTFIETVASCIPLICFFLFCQFLYQLAFSIVAAAVRTGSCDTTTLAGHHFDELSGSFARFSVGA